jgi:serine/threonine protein kinase
VSCSGYLPREFIDHGTISNKVDIFSLGVVILKMMVGCDAYLNFTDMSPGESFDEFKELVSYCVSLY